MSKKKREEIDPCDLIVCSECDRTLEEIEEEDEGDDENALFDHDLGVCKRCLDSTERDYRAREDWYNRNRG